MISVALAAALRESGLAWGPSLGDRFVVEGRGMDDDVFVLSNMTIEIHDYPSGPVIGFNGTTEWALDSLDQDEALWLPAEDQLRSALGGTFARLEHAQGMHTVVTTTAGHSAEKSFTHVDAAEAYGRALLDLLTGLRGSVD